MPISMLKVLAPLRVQYHGKLQHFPRGHLLYLPEDTAAKLIHQVGDRVSVVMANRPDELIGTVVVALQDFQGENHRIVREPGLWVVYDVMVKQEDGLKNGRWLLLVYGRTRALCHESEIMNWNPHCHACRGRAFWWSQWVIRCAGCTPPVWSEWAEIWQKIAAQTLGVLPENPRYPVLNRMLDECDEAYSQRDYVKFQACAIRLRWAIKGSMTPRRDDDVAVG